MQLRDMQLNAGYKDLLELFQVFKFLFIKYLIFHCRQFLKTSLRPKYEKICVALVTRPTLSFSDRPSNLLLKIDFFFFSDSKFPVNNLELQIILDGIHDLFMGCLVI